MALVSCSECGREVSTLAAACPHCGAPVGRGNATSREARGPIVTPGLLGKVATMIGAWLVVPWIVRVLAFVAGIVMLIVMFAGGRQ